MMWFFSFQIIDTTRLTLDFPIQIFSHMKQRKAQTYKWHEQEKKTKPQMLKFSEALINGIPGGKDFPWWSWHREHQADNNMAYKHKYPEIIDPRGTS